MLARENKGNSAGKSDKAAMQEVHDMLKKHYQVSMSRNQTKPLQLRELHNGMWRY